MAAATKIVTPASVFASERNNFTPSPSSTPVEPFYKLVEDVVTLWWFRHKILVSGLIFCDACFLSSPAGIVCCSASKLPSILDTADRSLLLTLLFFFFPALTVDYTITGWGYGEPRGVRSIVPSSGIGCCDAVTQPDPNSASGEQQCTSALTLFCSGRLLLLWLKTAPVIFRGCFLPTTASSMFICHRSCACRP